VRETSFGDDDAQSFFQQFFGRQVPRIPQHLRREGALWSGVIVNPNGYILTNNHLVAGAQTIKVELPDHRTFTAKVVGTDAPSDLAVLKIEATNLYAIKLGDSDQTRVGDVVLAVGDPLGVGETVTMDIVSAKGRATGLADGAYEDFIQTDAPINQGNSGGALVASVQSGGPGERAGLEQGDLITAINGKPVNDTNDLRNGIAAMAPGTRVALTVWRNGHERQVEATLAQLPDKRRASNDNAAPSEHGRLGISVEPLTPALANQLGTKAKSGVVVDQVVPGSPAASAGIREGDIIKQVNHKPVSSGTDLQQAIRDSGGRPALMLVERDHGNLFIAAAPDRGN
jgi:S1-C subfamily serine protease